ncbi:bacteriohemerythrin [Azospirillum halopraeferens]|uniref:bacteriohemerythrin n=1 Tax=Azospirillum halopraeferens TaxID=34010 RepID=UPI00041A3107|nr:hemerythrin family protein [Azospirillum halopraeferens]
MPALTALAWDPSLEVGNPVIDADHKETVEQLAALAAVDDAGFPALFAAFADHLREHLAREEELMVTYGFPPYPIHKHEHDRVRLELEGVEKRLAAGNLMLARGYVREVVPEWFINHKNTMDAATAAWIRSRGG